MKKPSLKSTTMLSSGISNHKPEILLITKFGGAMRDRTADLLRARQALSQLSYNPNIGTSNFSQVVF
jgi:hypothetical protein